MAQANITLTLDDAYVLAFRTYLAQTFMGGVMPSAAETLDWLNDKSQEMLLTFTRRAVEWAEANNPSVLPQAHQAALTAKQNGDAALETERAKITP